MTDQYDVAIVVPSTNQNHAPLIVHNLPVLGTELLAAQGFHVLIGRDLLSLCLLVYDGGTGKFSLAY